MSTISPPLVPRLNRRLGDRIKEAHRPGGHVPAVQTDGMDAKVRRRVEQLRQAREALAAGASTAAAAKLARLSERRLQRIMGRYLDRAWDGQLAGERVFLRSFRMNRLPLRRVPFNIEKAKTSGAGAYTGLFRKLLAEHVELRDELVLILRRKGKAALQVNRLVGRELRKMLTTLCEKHGVPADQYPLNTEDKGLRALRRWMRDEFMPRYARDWVEGEQGKAAAVTMTTAQLTPVAQAVQEVYTRWQLDEVRVDVRCAIELINEQGDVDVVEVERFSVIRVIELTYRTTLAYHIVLGRKATAYDVCELLWKAVAGFPAPPSVLQNLVAEPGAGFPVMLFEELRWKAPREIQLDNALEHLAGTLGIIVLRVFGAQLTTSAPASPLARPEIESRFALQARRLLHQLPGTTGSGPSDPLRKKNDGLEPHQLLKLDALEHAYHVMLMNENNHPTMVTFGVPPLERVRRAIVNDQIKAVPISLSHRERHMFFPAEKKRVQAKVDGKRRPFVMFKGVRYHSDQLNKRYDLDQQFVLVQFDPHDLRVIVLFDLNGVEICRAAGEGRWGQIPHDERMRRMSLQAIDRTGKGTMPQDAPLVALFASLQSKSQHDRGAALQLAHCLAVLGRHIDSAAVNAAALGDLLAAGGVLEAAAAFRPAANDEPRPVGPTQPASATQTVTETEPQPANALVPRKSVRRAA